MNMVIMASILTSPGCLGPRELPESALWSTVWGGGRGDESEAGAQLWGVCVAPHGQTANGAESPVSVNKAKVEFPSQAGFPGLTAGYSLVLIYADTWNRAQGSAFFRSLPGGKDTL